MPSGVFKPYAGVSTAVLLFTRGATTDRIWFYDMAYDGFSLDDKRQRTPGQNDIPDILECWHNRHNQDFLDKRQERFKELRNSVSPLKAERLKMLAEANRLTFESAIADDGDVDAQAALDNIKNKLAEIESKITPIQAQIDQLTRQFWVTKKQVHDFKYDLSASRYRQVEQDEEYYESPQVTLGRLTTLTEVMNKNTGQLRQLLK
jgi:type I restriction enzyme M protein